MWTNEMRFGGTWDPWRELGRLQEEVNRVFSGALETRSFGPAMNVWTNDEGAVLRAPVPDYDLASIDISVLGDSVTISGKRDPASPGGDVTYHRREREFGPFTRTLQLPYRIEADQVKAELKNGVLEVTLPRADADRPKRISVKAD